LLLWQSLDTWLITVISVAYLSLLFAVAYWGQKHNKWVNNPWVYSLSLGVSCTSWAFYGTVGQAAITGAWLAPIYIGSILCLVIAWPMLMRMLTIIKQQNLTSIADFIACRYDRSPKIAGMVTLVALVGTIPYIALQLRAISTSFDLLTGTFEIGISTAFVVTLVLIFFSILFGTRHISVSKQNSGLVLAIAFSSVIKIFALSAVGIFATYFVFDGFNDLLSHQASLPDAPIPNSIYLSVSQAILGAITIFILPQQFHMMMIESHQDKAHNKARWLFPIYLIAINIFVLPIAIAGQVTFPGGSINPDTFVLSLPLFYQQAWLGVFVYIGGLAAATSMVVVAAIVLSTMISTEILTPTILKFRLFNTKEAPQLSGFFLTLRRFAITIILLLAFAFERLIDQQNHLAEIGLLSFVLLAQCAPAIIGALYWRTATTKAALAGLTVGGLVWLYTLLLPLIFPNADWITNGPWQLSWLMPTALFGLTELDKISHGVFFSLAANMLCFVVISLLSKRTVGEKLQAEIFIGKKQRQLEKDLSTNDLYNLLQRFINTDAANKLLDFAKTSNSNNEALVEYTRLQLSGVLGSASTRMVMRAASVMQEMKLEDVASIVDEASQMFEFNRELLQSGVENIEQGISVIDADMRLVAWNQRYIELLDYPSEIVVAGTPIEKLLSFNVERGVISGSDKERLISKRLEHMRAGNSHCSRRTMPNGVVLEIRGQAMPGGGFVSTYSDITSHIEAEKALQLTNETLEKRVMLRTQELQTAKAEAEAANSSKTRFLAAASHDLMQPFNALSLFTSMLKKKVEDDELKTLANHIDDSLNVVEALLSDLVEISRLDGCSEKPEFSEFSLDELLSPLSNEFNALAEQENIKLKVVKSNKFVKTSKRHLRRILQNFLSNAVYYCNDEKNKIDNSGKIVCGARHLLNAVRIEVWDNGPGIPKDKQQKIFQEFERLEQNREVPGLGLGLAISERIAKLIGLQITLHSVENKGTCFAIEVPTVEAKSIVSTAENNIDNKTQEGFDTLVMVIDNEPLMLTAISSQLSDWGCRVLAAKDGEELRNLLDKSEEKPSIVVADYHLDDEQNGVDVVQQLLEERQWSIPCVICSADPSEEVRQHTSNANFQFLRKPVKSLALKRIIKQVLAD